MEVVGGIPSVSLSIHLKLLYLSVTTMSTTVRVGAVQAEPGWLDLEGSVNKTISLIESAAADGVQVVSVMASYTSTSFTAAMLKRRQGVLTPAVLCFIFGAEPRY